MTVAGITVPFLDVGAGYRELRAAIDAALQRVMAGGRYILGEEVEAFERAFAEYCGARHCIGVANGLDALHVALRGFGIGAGDEVIVPANTFIATWLGVSLSGATPVPVEADAIAHTIDPARLETAVTARTRAIVAVHLYGRPADTTAIAEIARRHDLRLIEDAAQAHGARLGGRRAGALGDAAAFSFYPTKNLGAFGDAGAIVTNDDDLAARVRLIRNYGSAVKYHHDVPGVNSRLDPLQAAMLAVKLRHLDEWNARRRAIADAYLAGLAGAASLTLPPRDGDAKSAWHLFVVRHPRRDQLAARLKAAGVETLVHYPIPPHLSGAYADCGWQRGAFPLAEQLADTALSLPIGPHLDPSMAAAVVDAVRSAAATL